MSAPEPVEEPATTETTKLPHPTKGKPRPATPYREKQPYKTRKKWTLPEARADKIVLSSHDIRQIEMLAGLRLSQDEIANIMGFSREALRRCRTEQPEIDLAIERGKAKNKASVTATAYRMATSGKSATMTQFWLECVEKWKKTIGLELSKKPIDEMTEEELRAQLDLIEAEKHATSTKPY